MFKTYPKEEIKDEDGVFDAQLPTAQSRHPCAVGWSLECICPSWILVCFGSDQSTLTPVRQAGARSDDAPVHVFGLI